MVYPVWHSATRPINETGSVATPSRFEEFLKVAASKGFLAATETWVVTHFVAWVATGLASLFMPHRDLQIIGDGMIHIEWVGILGTAIGVWYVWVTYRAAVDKCRSVYRLFPLMLISMTLGMMAMIYVTISPDMHIRAQMIIVWVMSLYLMAVKLRYVSFTRQVGNDIKKNM